MAKQSGRFIWGSSILSPGGLLALAFLLAGTVSPNAAAGTVTWTGATSTDFEVGTNWSTGTAPAATDDVVFGPGAPPANLPALTIARNVNSVAFSTPTGGWTLGGSGFILTIAATGINTTGQTSGTNTITCKVTLGAAQSWSVVNGLLDVQGAIGGANALTKTGAGTLQLSAANTYTGATTISAGTVVLANPSGNALGTGSVTVASGAMLDLNGRTTASPFTNVAGTGVGGIGAIVNSNTTTAAAITGTLTQGTNSFSTGGAGDITYATITGTAAYTVTKLGTGTVTLGGTADNAYLNAAVSAGKLVLAKAPSAAGVHASGSGTVVVNNGGILQLGGSGGYQINLTNSLTVNTGGTFDMNGQSQSVDILSGGGIIDNTNATAAILTVGYNNGGGTFSGTVKNASGAISLVKRGTGTEILSSANTFTGGTTLSGGVLELGNATALSTGGLSVNANATLQTTGALTIANTVTLSSSCNLTLSPNNQNTTLNGVISGVGSLVKNGTATVTLANTNTYSGNTVLNSGTLTVGTNNALSAGSLLSINGGTLTSSTSVTLPNPIVMAADFAVGGTQPINFTGPAQITPGATRTITVTNTSNTTTFAAISGVGSSLIKAGANTLTLTGNCTYSGSTAVNAGTLDLQGDSGQLSATTALTVNLGATFAIDNTGTANVAHINPAANVVLNGGTFVSSAPSSGNTARADSVANLQLAAGSGSSTLALSSTSTANCTLTVGSYTPNNAMLFFNRSFPSTNANGSKLLLNPEPGTLPANYPSIYVYEDNSGGSPNTGIGQYKAAGTGIVCPSAGLNGQIYTSNAAGGINWNSGGGNWIVNVGAVTVPGANDIVIIKDNHTVNLTAAQSCYALIFNAVTGGNGTLGPVGGGPFALTVGAGGILVNASNNPSPAIGTGVLLNWGPSPLSVSNAGTGTLNINAPGALTGTGGLVLGGTGAVGIAGDNSSYSGTTTLDSGFLNVGATSALGTGPLVINGGTITATFPLILSNPVTINGNFGLRGSGVANTLTFSNNWTLTTAATVTCSQAGNFQAPAVTVGGVISDGGSNFGLTKSGASDLILTNANTYTGLTTVNQGRLVLQAGNTNLAALAGDVVVNQGGSLAIDGSGTVAHNYFTTAAPAVTLNGGDLTMAAPAGVSHVQALSSLVLGSGSISSINLSGAGLAAYNSQLTLGSLTCQPGAQLALTRTFTAGTSNAILTLATPPAAGTLYPYITVSEIAVPAAQGMGVFDAGSGIVALTGTGVTPAGNTYTYSGANNGAWETPANWMPVALDPSGPQAGDNVIIPAGLTVAITAAPHACNSLTFLSNSAVQTSGISGAGTLTVASGNVTVMQPSTTGGIKGEYYSNMQFGPFTSPSTRLEASLNNGALATPSGQTLTFSAVFTGFIVPPTTDNYTIDVNGDDGIRLFVNGEMIGNSWEQGGPRNNNNLTNRGHGNVVPMVAGVKYPVRVEMYQNTGGGAIALHWTAPSVNGGNIQAIPLGNLVPGSGTITIGCNLNFGATTGSITNQSMGTLNISGTIPATSTAGVKIDGCGIVQLNSANAYAGNTTLSAHALYLGNNNSLGAAASTLVIPSGLLNTPMITQAMGVTVPNLTIPNPISLSSDVILTTNATNMTYTGNVALNGNRTVTLANVALMAGPAFGTVTLAGNVTDGTGTTTFTKAGTGNLLLSGTANQWGATQINRGTLKMLAAGSIPANVPMTIFGNYESITAGGATTFNPVPCTLDLSGFPLTVSSLTTASVPLNIGEGPLNNNQCFVTSTFGGVLTINNFSDVTWPGVFQANLAVVKNGAGALVLTNTPTTTGSLTVNGGTFSLVTTWLGSLFVNNAGTVVNLLTPTTPSVSTTVNDGTLNILAANISPNGALVQNGGNIVVSNSGSIGARSVTLSGGSFTIDGTALAPKVFAGTPVLNFGGGTLNMFQPAAGSRTENLSGLSFQSGASTINLNSGGAVMGLASSSALYHVGYTGTVNFNTIPAGDVGTNATITAAGTVVGAVPYATVNSSVAKYDAVQGLIPDVRPPPPTFYSNKDGADFNNPADWDSDAVGTPAGAVPAANADVFIRHRNITNSFSGTNANRVNSLTFTGSGAGTLGGANPYYFSGLGSGIVVDASAPASLSISAPLNFGTLEGNIAHNGAASNSIALNGAITASAGITKSGTGTAILGADNSATVTGTGFGIAGGTLSISADNNLGNAALAVTINGGTLQAAGTTAFTSNRSIALGIAAATIEVLNMGGFTAAGVISSQGTVGGLIKTGPGTLTVSGVNTFTGGTPATAIVLKAGMFSTNNDNQLGAGTNGITFDGGTFYNTFNGQYTFGTARAFTFAAGGGTIFCLNNGTAGKLYLNAANQFTGSGTFTKSGAGMIQFTGACANPNFTGNVVVMGGALEVQGAGNLSAAGTITLDNDPAITPYVAEVTISNITVANNIIVTPRGGVLSSEYGTNTINASLFSGSITLNGPLAFGLRQFWTATPASGYLTISGPMSGSGNATLALSNPAGGTANPGQLYVLGANAGYSGLWTIPTNATLQIDNNVASATLGSGALMNLNGTLTWASAASVTCPALSGTGTLIHRGNSTLALSSPNTLATIKIERGPNATDNVILDLPGSGTTTVTGTISVGTAGNGNAAMNIRGSHTLNTVNFMLGDATSMPGTVNQSGGTVNVSGQVRVGHYPTETSTYNLSGGTLNVTAASSGTNPFQAGTQEYNGTVYLGIDGTGVLNQSGGTLITPSLVLDNRGDTGGTDTYTMTGGTLILGNWGIQGNASTLVNLGGGTVIASATWNPPAVGARPITLTGTNGDVVFNTNGFNIVLDGVVSGSAGLAKTGAGSLILNAVNTFTGTLAVNGGTVKAGNAGALGDVAGNGVTVAPGGAVDFNGQAIGAKAFASVNGGGVANTGALTNSSATAASFAGNIMAGNPTVGSTAGNLTLSGVLSGAGVPLTKIGSGTVILSAANTYTGLTTVSAGTLRLQGNTGAISGNLTVGGGTLEIDNTAGADVGRIPDTAVVTLSGGSFVMSAGNTMDRLETIGSLVFTPGTSNAITLIGNGAFSSRLTVASGTFASLNLTGSTFLNLNRQTAGGAGTGNLILTGQGSDIVGPIANTTVNYQAAQYDFTGGQGLIQNGGTGALRYTVAAGNWNAAGTWDGGATVPVAADTVVIRHAITLDVSPTVQAVVFDNGGNTGTLAPAAMTLTVTSGRVSVQGAGTTGTINSVLAGGALIKDGAGSLVLTATNTYAAPTTINGGSLLVAADGNLGTAPGAPATNIILNGGGLYLNSAGPGADITLSPNRTIAIGNAGGTLGNLNTVWRLWHQGVITNIAGQAGALTFAGPGQIVMGSASANTYSAGTTLAANAFIILASNSNAPFGAGTVNILGGQMRSSITAPGNTVPNPIVLSGDLIFVSGGATDQSLTFTGSVTLVGTGARVLTVNTNVNPIVFSGTIGDGGNAVGLTKTGLGTLTLSNAAPNTFTGPLSVNGGSLNVAAANNISSASALNISGGALLYTGAAAATLPAGGTCSPGTAYTITNKALTTNVATLTVSTNFAVGQVVNVAIGDPIFDGYVVLTVVTGTTISYSRTNADVASAAAAGTVTGIGTINVQNAGCTLTMAGAFGGAGGLCKAGAGTMVLSGQSTYVGTTIVAAGTLSMGTNNALAASSDIINAAATLDFGGFTAVIRNLTTIVDRADAPINGVGNLTVNGNCTLGQNAFPITVNRTSTLTTVAGSTLKIGSGSGSNLTLGTSTYLPNGANVSAIGVLDARLSAAVQMNLGILRVGYAGATGGTLTSIGQLRLPTGAATTTSIVASDSIRVGDSAGMGNAAVTQILTFGGGVNTISTPKFSVGYGKGSGNVTVAAGGTVNFVGVTAVNIGDQYNNGGTGTLEVCTVDFSGGILNAPSWSTVVVGAYPSTGANGGSGTGTLTLGNSANVLNIGTLSAGILSGTGTSSSATTGTININGGTVSIGSATLGSSVGNPTAAMTGTINVAGGNVIIGAITMGRSTGTPAVATAGTLNITGGTVNSTGVINPGGGTLTTNTLTIANGSTVNSNNNNVGNLSTLTFSGGNWYNPGGIARALTQTGGTLIRNAAGTTSIAGAYALNAACQAQITAGTVSVNGSITTNNAGSVITVDGGMLTFPAPNTLAVGQLVYRSGGITNLAAGGATLSGIGDALILRNVDVNFAVNLTGASGGNIHFENANNAAGAISGPLNMGALSRSVITEDIVAAPIDLTISGVISNGGLNKTGAGTLVLSGVNTYAGNTTATTGIILINGTQPASTVALAGGTVGGTGTAGPMTGTPGEINPGSPVTAPGTLKSGNLTLNNPSILTANLASSTAYDQLSVTGTVNLGNGALNVVLGYVPAPGDSFTLINNDGNDAVVGTFNGIPEGGFPVIGGHIFQLTYAGGTNNNDVVLTRIQGAITVTLSSSLNPSKYGDAVTFSSHVSTVVVGGPAITGTVTFSSDGVALSTVNVDVAGDASFSTSTLPAGTHAIVATYNGATEYAAANSPTVSQVVTKLSTLSGLSSSKNPSCTGDSVTFTAMVIALGSTNIPAGSVQFTLNGANLGGPVALDAIGHATQVLNLPAGDHVLGAAFLDNINFAGSMATPITQSVIINTAPTIAPILGVSLNQGQILNIAAIGHDNDLASPFKDFAYSITAGPAWVSVNPNTGAITGLAARDGTGDVTVQVTDGGGLFNSTTFHIDVINANTAPLIAALGTQTPTQGVFFTITAVGTDNDPTSPNKDLTYSLTSAPVWLSIVPATGVISGMPPNNGSGTVTVRVTDGGTPKLYAETTFAVNVIDADDAPVLDPIANLNMTQGQWITFQATAHDIDPAGPNSTLVFSNNAGLTWVNVAPSGLITGQAPNNGSGSVTVRVTDGGGLFDEKTFTITVADVNDPPTIDVISTQTVPQGNGFSIQAFGHDLDPDVTNSTLTYTLTSAPAWVSILGNVISGTAPNGGDGNVTVRVTDGGGLYAETTFAVVVTDLNQNPTLDPFVAVTLAQGQSLNIQAYGHDIDPPGLDSTLTYSLDTAPAWVNIDSVTGSIVGVAANAGSGGVTVRVTDGGGLFATQSFNITVTDVNDRPTLLGIPNQTVTQGNVLTVNVVGSDIDPAGANHNLTYSLVTAPAWLSIVPATGVISGTAPNGGSGIVVVRVSDGGAPVLYSEVTFLVTVDDVNEAPTLDLIPNMTVTQNSAIAYQAIAHDTDPAGPDSTLTFTKTAGLGWVSIDPDGLITGQAPNNGTGSVTIRVTDGGTPGLFAERTFSITVTDVNDPPTVTQIPDVPLFQGDLLSVTIFANDIDPAAPFNTLGYSLTLAPAWVSLAGNVISGTAPNAGSGLVIVRVTDGGGLFVETVFNIIVTDVNDGPTLDPITDVTVTQNQSIALQAVGHDIDPAAPNNTLTYSKTSGPAWVNVSPTGLITGTAANAGDGDVIVRVTDGGTLGLLVERTFHVTVIDVNDTPTLLPIGPVVMVAQNAPLVLSAIGADIDPAAPNSTIAYSLVSAPAWVTIDPVSGAFGGTAANGGSGMVTVRVTDGGTPPLYAERTFTLAITDLNEAPTLDPIGNVTLAQGAQLNIQANGHDIDPTAPNNVLTYSLDAAPAWVSINPTSGAIVGVAANNGSGTVTVRVTDGGTPGLFATRLFTVTVTNVNDPPVLNAIATVPITSGQALSVTATAVDPDVGEVLTYAKISGPAWVNVAGNGAITGTAINGGTGSVTVRVTDLAGAYDEMTFLINVTDVNTAPTLSAIGNVTLTQGDLLYVPAQGDDVDPPGPNSTLTYVLVSAPAWVTLDPTAGVLAGVAPNNNAGSGLVTLHVTDGGTPSLSSANVSFTVTVNNINDPPKLSPLLDVTLLQNTNLNVTATASDPDVTDILTFVKIDGPAWVNVAANGAITGVAANAGSGLVTIGVSDGLRADQASFFVTVTDVNDGPTLDPVPAITVLERQAFVVQAYGHDIDPAAPNNTLVYSKSAGLTWVNVGAGGMISGEAPNNGSGTVTVRVTDGGTPPVFAEQIVTINVLNVNDAPVMNPILDVTVVQGQNLSATATASDADTGDTLTFSKESGPAWVNVAGNGAITGIAANAGSGSVTVRVTDGSGATDKATFIVTVTDINDPPTLDSIPPLIVVQGAMLGVQAVGHDIDPAAPNNTLTYSMTSGPAWVTVGATGSITGVAPNNGGGSLTVLVSDALGAFAEQTTTITVIDANDIPTLDPIPDVTLAQNTALSVTATGHDIDPAAPNNVLSYSLTSAPSWVTIDAVTGAMTGTAANLGSGTVVVRVSDGGTPVLYAEQKFTITVTDINDAPTLLPMGDVSLEAGTLLNVMAIGRDIDPPGSAKTLSYNLLAAPAWVSINQITGAISGIALAGGSGKVTVQVLDAGLPRLSAQTSFNITVISVNPVPVITDFTPGAATTGDADFTLVVSGIGFNSTSVVQFGGIALPTTAISSTTLSATVSTAVLTMAGQTPFVVVNPAPGGGASNAKFFTLNGRPVIASPATATPNPAAPGQDIVLSVSASDPENKPLTVTWDLGDGTTAMGSSVTHHYSTANTYAATATVYDPDGGKITSSIAVVVAAPATSPSTLVDTDGDGFPDTMELAAGSSPTNAADTPGNAPPVKQTIPLTDAKLRMKLNFVLPSSDSIQLSATILLGEMTQIGSQMLAFSVGNVSKSVVLDLKGGFKATGISVKLTSKGLAPRMGKLSIKLSKGAFAELLAGNGLTKDTAALNKPVDIPLYVLFDNKLFQKAQHQLYTCKPGKSGTTKDAPL
ncbi:MAG TPA: putative Ig domain-containing protein [Planctomycetota bacterium]|jgi:autotransporter-associated beta strand protein